MPPIQILPDHTREFSRYIVYVDESGSPNLNDIDSENPLFTLAFCVFEKDTYMQRVVPSVQKLKFDFWGHDGIVLHSYDVRKERGPFALLRDASIRLRFLSGVNSVIGDAPFTLIASVINKRRLVQNYVNPSDPYDIAMTFCMERLARFLDENGQQQAVQHVIVERRGEPADSSLELAFRRICDGANQYREMPLLNIIFADKKHNSTGLQFSDLVAYPITRHTLKPEQANSAFNIVQTKFRSGPAGKINGFGLKIFP
jgi:Protein of unknown function (DUF3800)